MLSGSSWLAKVITLVLFLRHSIDHIRILGNGLELACNRGSCGGTSRIEKNLMAFKNAEKSWGWYFCRPVFVCPQSSYRDNDMKVGIFPVVLFHAFCMSRWPICKNMDLSFIWGHHHLQLVNDRLTSRLITSLGSLSTRTFKATPSSFERLRLGRGLLRMTYPGLPTLCYRRRRELSGFGGVVKVVSDVSGS